jgi:hypothetical protein
VQEVEGRQSEAEGGVDHMEGMIQSRDKLIMDMAEEYGLIRMIENNDDEDDNDKGNTVTPPTPTPAPAPTPAAVPEEIIEEEAPMEMVPKQEAPVAHKVILADVEPEPP